ncbi:hypothetical protein E2C01_028108 [Portunus trituberculatus]|uniref:Uncharacterized protein n=1 Tax=Portunus trituberculatus TaxID=210409 RepID=A0A5B7EN10_PORTR|nr:hypothetical protein [Portunus trituberculatus]
MALHHSGKTHIISGMSGNTTDLTSNTRVILFRPKFLFSSSPVFFHMVCRGTSVRIDKITRMVNSMVDLTGVAERVCTGPCLKVQWSRCFCVCDVRAIVTRDSLGWLWLARVHCCADVHRENVYTEMPGL